MIRLEDAPAVHGLPAASPTLLSAVIESSPGMVIENSPAVARLMG